MIGNIFVQFWLIWATFYFCFINKNKGCEECSYQTVSKNAEAAIGKCCSEAVTQRCSVKKPFLEISWNSQENICASLFITKVAGNHQQLYLKRDPGTGVSCEFCKIWKNTFSYITPLVADSSSPKCWRTSSTSSSSKSSSRCSYKFPDIHQKIPVLKSLFNTVSDLKARNSNKKETQHQCFCEYHKIFKNSCFIEHPRWLLLNMVQEFLRISNSS